METNGLSSHHYGQPSPSFALEEDEGRMAPYTTLTAAVAHAAKAMPRVNEEPTAAASRRDLRALPATTRARAPLRGVLRRVALLALYVMAATQFVGAYLYLEFPYVDLHRWEYGYERLPFQTRLLLAPLYRLVDTAPWSTHYAESLARNQYFFPHGVTAGMVLDFYSGIACVLFSGWVAVRLYEAGSRRRLVGPLVFPIFLGLCVLAYVLHTVQNFRYVYDLPSLAAFAGGFYLIYFRKPLLWFVLLFTVATLNRETTLLLLPFWALSQSLGPDGRIRWRTLGSPGVLGVVGALTVYWAVWHHMVFGIFATNASEYYPRLLFNLKCFVRLRYWPQLASAFGFLWPFLILYRRHLRDAQLRAWLLVLPVWYAFMLLWAIVTETRVFGELIPFLAPVAAILAEEVFAAKVLQQNLDSGRPAGSLLRKSRAA